MFREYSRNISRKYSLDINEKHSLNIFRKYSLDITAANIREYSYQCGNVQGVFSEYFSQIFAGHYPCEYSRIFGVSWDGPQCIALPRVSNAVKTALTGLNEV